MPKILTTKDELIEKSTEVFLRNGYYNSSISDLASACGIEKSHFYYYFKDKRDLMNQCLGWFSQKIQTNVFDVAADTSIKPSARVKKMFGYVFKIHTQDQYGCLFGNTLQETVGKEPFFEHTIRDFFERWKRALVSLYAEAAIKTNLEELAYEDIQKLQGSIMLMKLYKDKSLLKRAINQISGRFKSPGT